MTFQNCAHPNELPRRRTILLVEDEPFVREATCRHLESAGFEVLPTVDARDAMRVYAECKRGIDLVIADVGLPGRTGQQLGQDLREPSPEVTVLVTPGLRELGVRGGSARVTDLFSGEAVFQADAGRKD